MQGDPDVANPAALDTIQLTLLAQNAAAACQLAATDGVHCVPTATTSGAGECRARPKLGEARSFAKGLSPLCEAGAHCDAVGAKPAWPSAGKCAKADLAPLVAPCDAQLLQDRCSDGSACDVATSRCLAKSACK